jgi:hypothetical protein
MRQFLHHSDLVEIQLLVAQRLEVRARMINITRLIDSSEVESRLASVGFFLVELLRDCALVILRHILVSDQTV